MGYPIFTKILFCRKKTGSTIVDYFRKHTITITANGRLGIGHTTSIHGTVNTVLSHLFYDMNSLKDGSFAVVIDDLCAKRLPHGKVRRRSYIDCFVAGIQGLKTSGGRGMSELVERADIHTLLISKYPEC